MKKIFIILGLLFVANGVWSQDKIITKNKEQISAKVLEIEELIVKYKKFDNLEGPTYSIKKSDIVTIIYQNGNIENFNDKKQPVVENQLDRIIEQEPNLLSNNSVMTEQQFKNMNRKETKDFLITQVGGDISDKYMKGVKLRTYGNAFLGSGLGSVASGVIVLLFTDITTGIILTSIGGVATLVSVPIYISGNAKQRSAKREYIKTHLRGNQTYYQPSINFGVTSNGIGLTLNF
ncbi:MAG: hypothetical protein LBN95_14025 [Prevotellaceae bacterium]|jgi:hypothetical protein|nr:hypothetical protein [Prevotellaceae bacterium]